MTKAILSLGVFLFFSTSLFSQNKAALERKKANINAKIALTSKLLADAKNNKTKVLSSYETLQEQIENRNELIKVMEDELNLMDSIILFQQSNVDNLKSSFDSLSLEYGEMMRLAIRQKLQDSRLQFILAGNSLTEYYNRWRFLKSYQSNREQQMQRLNDTKSELDEKLIALKLVRDEKHSLVSDEAYQNELLSTDLVLMQGTLKTIRENEVALKASLAEQAKNRKNLEREIQKIIENQVVKSNEQNSNKNINKSSPKNNSNEAKYAANFLAAKGKLSWPLMNGVIVRKFGTQAHPTLKGINISNNGIDIRSNPGATVKSVFKGEVIQKQNIAGYANVIVIRHGKYYTVFSNVGSTDVEIGQQIEQGQNIGFLPDTGAVHEDLHFEVWKGKVPLNPIRWIKK